MSIKFKMAARCEAAGRPNNEDNFQLNDNLSNSLWGFTTDKPVSLDEKGALLVVCDGMGGMNAGEVASASAIQTIKEKFMSDHLTGQILETPDSIMRYIEKAIIEADTRIKEESKKDKAKEGMGSTIVLAWLVEKNVYIGWCGDSRAYRFNPAFGLEQLSHDHSYVQELVDAGKLTQELAFDHPDSNIITRSLGDPRQKARPDVKCFPLYDGDIILLCSDGLSGVLRDREMETIIAQHTDSMENCRDVLWNESEKIGWHDNVTTALCQVISGGEKTSGQNQASEEVIEEKKRKGKTLTIALIVLLIFILIAGAFEGGVYFGTGKFWLPNFGQTQKCKTKQELLECIGSLRKKYRDVSKKSRMSSSIDNLFLQLDSLEDHVDTTSESEISCDLSKKYIKLDNRFNDSFSKWREELNEVIDTIFLDDPDQANTFKSELYLDRTDTIIPFSCQKEDVIHELKNSSNSYESRKKLFNELIKARTDKEANDIKNKIEQPTEVQPGQTGADGEDAVGISATCVGPENDSNATE
jgi:serine/threonine protein phosphatase PrpC